MNFAKLVLLFLIVAFVSSLEFQTGGYTRLASVPTDLQFMAVSNYVKSQYS